MPVIHAMTALMRRAGRSLLSALVSVFGRWNRHAPGWLAWLDGRARTGWRFVTANPTRASAAAAMVVITGAGYVWYASRPTPRHSAPHETIALEAATASDVRRVFWFDGRALIAVRQVADGALPWRPTTAGMHLIRVVDDHGRSAERDVEVRLTP